MTISAWWLVPQSPNIGARPSSSEGSMTKILRPVLEWHSLGSSSSRGPLSKITQLLETTEILFFFLSRTIYTTLKILTQKLPPIGIYIKYQNEQKRKKISTSYNQTSTICNIMVGLFDLYISGNVFFSLSADSCLWYIPWNCRGLRLRLSLCLE